MTEQQAPLIATVGFNRKVSVRQYESAEASIFIQTEIPNGDPEGLVKACQDAFYQAKSIVFSELGIEFEVLEDGRIMELVNRHLGPVTEVSSAPAAIATADSPAAGAGDVPPNPPYDSRTTDKGERSANITWAKKRYAAYPSEFYDNRESNAEKKANGAERTGPDFRHKSSGVGYWL